MTDMPKATHEGETEILGIKVRAYRLDDGRAIIHADDFHKVLEAMGMAGVVSEPPERDNESDEIERLREQLADTKDDCLRRHRDACDRWEALMDIRLIANEPGDRRAIVDKIYGIATKALHPITEASRYTSPVGGSREP